MQCTLIRNHTGCLIRRTASHHSPWVVASGHSLGAAVGWQRESGDRGSGPGKGSGWWMGSCRTWSADPGAASLRRKLKSPVHCPHLLPLGVKDMLSSPLPCHCNTMKLRSDASYMCERCRSAGSEAAVDPLQSPPPPPVKECKLNCQTKENIALYLKRLNWRKNHVNYMSHT